MKPRAGLAQLMGLIAVVSLGLAAMKVASFLVATAVVLASVTALLVGMVGARVRQKRAAWVGFSLFGWGYVVILLIPMLLPLAIPLNDAAAVRQSWAEINQPIDQCILLLHPDLSEPSQPFEVFFDTNGQTKLNTTRLPLTPDESKLFDSYLHDQALCDERLRARACAKLIALAIQGVAFAFIGAAVGHFLDDRSRTTGNPPEAPTSNSPG
jgi:hypothetical protein